MGFKSFIDNIEMLNILPTLEKGADGYFYNPDMYNKIYRHNKSILVVSETAIDEIQIPLIEAIYGSIEEGISADVKSALSDMVGSNNNSDIIEEVNSSISVIEGAIQQSMDSITAHDGRIKELEDMKPSITSEMIQKMIDMKLENTPARAGKIKISTLSMLKESGFSIDEISELAKSDLI